MVQGAETHAYAQQQAEHVVVDWFKGPWVAPHHEFDAIRRPPVPRLPPIQPHEVCDAAKSFPASAGTSGDGWHP
eukprot:224256-Lingulodinium_polyedra.AAC.1